MDVNLYELFISAGIAVKRAREMARGGRNVTGSTRGSFIGQFRNSGFFGFPP
jgi:hypothetical protein